MGTISRLGRRGFLATVSAATGSFSLGWTIPTKASAQGAAVEVGIWAVIHPDDTHIITNAIDRPHIADPTLKADSIEYRVVLPTGAVRTIVTNRLVLRRPRP